MTQQEIKHALYRTLKESKQIILTIFVLSLVQDIFFGKGSSDVRIFVTLFLYMVISRFYRLGSRLTYGICLFVLAAMVAGFLFSGPSESTEKAAVWLFIFLLVGIIQQWRE